jgi:hypothetical protein
MGGEEGGGVGGKGGGGGRGQKWPKPCMHIWIIKEKKKKIVVIEEDQMKGDRLTKYFEKHVSTFSGKIKSKEIFFK